MNDEVRNSLRACALMLAASTILSACGGSAPSEFQTQATGGAAGAGTFEETWQGSTLGANPTTAAGLPAVTPCSTAEDPSCGHHRLVLPATTRQVLIAIQPDQENQLPEDGAGTGAATNDYTLMVYDDQNTLIAYSESASGSAVESVVIDNTGSAYYDVRVSPFLVAPGSTFTGMATEVVGRPVSDAAECLEPVPASFGTAGITDAGERIELSVELLLDGTDPARAREVMAKAAESYAPLGIDLTLHSMRPVTIQSIESSAIIEEGKQASAGGVPPAGVDVVVVFTNKDMQAYDPSGQAATVIGQADCLGGIRYPTHSFAVVTDVSGIEKDEHVPGFFLNIDAAAETLAHEIGHLMGAHHHYGNCVEGNLTSGGDGDVSPCTLMFPAVNGASLNFGTFEGVVVRGHAVDFAAP
jgi:hypothetical protein